MITCFMQYMWIFTQTALISFFPTETNALIQVVIMLKSSVHVCVHVINLFIVSQAVSQKQLVPYYQDISHNNNTTTWFQDVAVHSLITQDSTEAA